MDDLARSLAYGNLLREAAERHPNAPALASRSEGTLSYRAFFESSTAFASTLREKHSVRKGDRVAILARNSIDHFVLHAATERIGAVIVPLNYRHSSAELRRVAADCDPAVIFCAPALERMVSDAGDVPGRSVRIEGDALRGSAITDLRPQDDRPVQSAAGDDPAMLLYTSGTTGTPKGVVVTRGMLDVYASTAVERYQLTSEDRALISIPLYHTGAWNVAGLPLLHAGGRLSVAARFDPVEHLRIIEQQRITIFPAVPTMIRRMIESDAFRGADLSSLRCVILGGEAAPAEVVRTLVERGIDVWQNFGMTEAGPGVLALAPPDAVLRPGSVGRPGAHVKVKLVDERGREVSAGTPGELLVSGPAVTPGYWNDPSGTAAVIQEGWLRTEDMLWRDEDGYHYLAGRAKEMYVSGGENVYPAEVEHALCEHPDVSAAAVVAVPDERWGETGAAFVVSAGRSSLDANSLAAFLSGRLARYKLPRHWFFVEALPLNPTGKVDRRGLKEAARRAVSGR